MVVGWTIGCAHPDGVILAGAGDHNTGNHVVLLNVRTKQPVPLPDINQVHQLNVGGDGGWVKLPSLPHTVANPMLVCDDSYVYVLGGDGCKLCVKLPKINHNVNGHVTFTSHDLEHSEGHLDHTGVRRHQGESDEMEEHCLNKVFNFILLCCLAVKKINNYGTSR